MIFTENTSGFASAMQLYEATGQSVMATTGMLGTSASIPYALFAVGENHIQAPIETKGDKLAAIRMRSHSEFGEAWSALAQM